MDWLTEGRAFSLQVWRWLRFTGDKWDKKQLFSLPLLWPLSSSLTGSHGSVCTRFHLWPLCTFFSQKSQWQSTHRHKAQIVSLSIFIFLRVVTVDTPTPALVFDRFVTHVHQPYLNQRQTIDCLHTQMIFFFLMSHASKPSLAKYRSTYLQIKINTIHLHHWACQ